MKVISKKFKSYAEARTARQQAERLIGREVLIKPYFKHIGISLLYIEKIYNCLKS